MDVLMKYMAQPSTWRGILALATAFGVVISPELATEIIAAGIGLAGVVKRDAEREMTELYVIVGGVAFCIFVVWLLVGKTADSAKFKERMDQQEAENELRKEMAEVDAGPNVDNPLDRL